MMKVPVARRLRFCQKATCGMYFNQPTSVAEGVLDFCMTTEVS